MKHNLIILLILGISLITGCGKKDAPVNQENNSKNMETVEFKCSGMHCSGCENNIKAEVNKLDGIKEVKADATTKLVSVVYFPEKTNKEKISKAINEAGYDTELTKSEKKHDCEKEENK
jgi:copper chaperone CopZ